LYFKLAQDVEVNTKAHIKADVVPIPGKRLQISPEVPIQQSTPKKSNIMHKITKAFVPIAASIGFVVAPSGTANRIAGAAVGGLTGFLAKKMFLDRLLSGDDFDSLDPHRVERMVKLLKQLKLDITLANADLKTIESLAKKNKVSEQHLNEFFTYLFAEALLAVTKSEDEDLLDLGNMIEFSESIGFSDSEVCDGFTESAVSVTKLLVRDESGFYSSQYPQSVLLQAAKIYFLSDKLMKTSSSYYKSRLDSALSGFTEEQYSELLSRLCRDMYRTFVFNVLDAPSQFSEAEANQYAEFLHLSPRLSEFRPATMQNSISEAVQRQVEEKLTLSTTDAPVSINFDTLSQARTVLGWNSIEFEATVEGKTLPVFYASAKELLERSLQAPERVQEYADTLKKLVQSLSIDTRKVSSYLHTIISEKNSIYMNRIRRVYEISEGAAEAAFKILIGYAQTWEMLKSLTDPVCADAAIPIPGLPFARLIRAQIYQVQLDREKAGAAADGEESISRP
jgi:hypothetical protein